MGFFDKVINKRSAATERLAGAEEPCGGFSLTYYSPYNTNSITLSGVYAAVELISNAIAQIPIHIKDKFSGDILENTGLELVFQDNIQSKYTIIKQMVSDMLLNGNGVAYIRKDGNGKPNGLIYCPKGTYTIVYDEIAGTLYYQIPKISSKKIDPKNVIHILKNSADGVNGKGFFTYASRTVQNAINAEEASSSYYESGCSVNAILKSDRKLSKKQKEEIEQAWNLAHNGHTKNSIAVLGVDLNYVPLSNNAADSQLVESRLFNLQEIARFFNINPVLLGDLSHSSYSSLEQAQQEFLIHTLSPIIALMEDEFNRKLCKDTDFVIDIDENHILLSDKNSTANYLEKMTKSGIMTRNEARHLLGLRPVEGADDLLMPYTDVNMNKVGTEEGKSESEKIEINKEK